MSSFPNPASPTPSPAPANDSRRADRLRGLVIVGSAFVLCLLLSVWAKRRSAPVFSAPPAPPSTVGIVGFPTAVVPTKTLARARELTPRNLLRTIAADNVKSDGTVDVSSPSGRVRYAFQSAPGEGPEPVREPGTLARRPSCGRQNIDVRRDGIVADPDAADTICSPHPVDPLPEPHCTFADVWARALARGVPKERLAHIDYYRSSAGPAYHFEAAHPRGRFSLYGDCQRELEPKDAVNVGP
ncbi:MAG: hypothetical protein ABUL62_21210 [Myxococcales bacterium]|jgi:hypothetical protein